MRWQGEGRSPSARKLASLVALALALPGCLLDPLHIGPGDELSGDESGVADSLGDSSGDSSSTGDESSSGSESDSSTGIGEPCGIEGALPPSICETFLGYYWDGADCVGLSGCSCNANCPELFETAVDCWLAHLVCGPSPCAGLDEPSCLANDLCAAHYAQPIGLDVQTACLEPAVYAGCGLALPCGDSTTYACHVLEPSVPFSFANACLPEFDWFACDPPPNEPLVECP